MYIFKLCKAKRDGLISPDKQGTLNMYIFARNMNPRNSSQVLQATCSALLSVGWSKPENIYFLSHDIGAFYI